MIQRNSGIPVFVCFLLTYFPVGITHGCWFGIFVRKGLLSFSIPVAQLILKEYIDPEFRRLQSEAREVRDAAHGSAPRGHGGDRQAGAKAL